jgi:hypothetical protein
MDNILKIIEEIRQAEVLSEHYKSRLENLKESIQSAFDLFREEANDEQKAKLLHQLYWYYDMDTNMIGELMKIHPKKVFNIAGPIYEQIACKTCKQSFVVQIRSKTQQPPKICTQCLYDDYQQKRTKVLSRVHGQSVPEDYNKYLRSKHWKKTREKALIRADYQCQLCASKDSVLNVHHNSYERIGKEQDKDLIVLCRPCHRRFHN